MPFYRFGTARTIFISVCTSDDFFSLQYFDESTNIFHLVAVNMKKSMLVPL